MSEWDEALFRRSLAALVERGAADGNLWSFTEYWRQSLDDAEASGALTGVQRDVLFSDLQATISGLPGITVIEQSSGASIRVPFEQMDVQAD